MHTPPNGGPPPHRHDFEEMFSTIEGEIEVTCRGKKSIVRAGETINIPANGPHQYQKHERLSSAAAMHVLAGRARRVFHGGRRPGRDSDNGTA
jgi:quercetin dioxygenase-like cupin family protein